MKEKAKKKIIIIEEKEKRQFEPGKGFMCMYH